MIETRGELDLSEEPVRAESRGEIGMQNLERNQALMLCILREIYSCHSTASKLAVDGVILGKCIPDTIEWCAVLHVCR